VQKLIAIGSILLCLALPARAVEADAMPFDGDLQRLAEILAVATDIAAPAQPKEQTYGVAGSDGRYQLLALVESTRRKSWRVILKTDLPDDDLHAESWVSLYPGADWHEREAWEMYGFVFDGHPSLRHLYLPSEFEGHPLRKDYPLLAREVKPWPGLVDVEPMPGEPADDDAQTAIEAGESA